MLDLESRVDLEEIELAVAEDELNRSRVDVAGGARGPDGGFAHRRPDLWRDCGRGRLFHDLLMAALDRAFALAQVHSVAVAVADDLDLDVARLANVALQVDRSPSPKADRAAWALLSTAATSSASDSTTFIPIPPPPPDGFTITGKPISRAAATASARICRSRRCRA